MAKQNKIKPIYVIAGKDPALVKRQAQDCLAQCLPADQHNMGLLSLDGNEAQISQVLDELRTLPFLSDRRVVLIREADSFVSQNRPALEHYFEQPCDTATLILAVGTWQKTTKLAKKLSSMGELITIDPPKPWQMPAEAVTYAQDRYQRKLHLTAAQLLVELTGDDWARVCNEIDKLVIFADQAKSLTVEHIEQLIGHNRVYGAFDVIEALSQGNRTEAVKRLRNMFSEDKNAQYTVVGAFAYHVRRLFQGKALLAQGQSQQAVAQSLKLWARKDAFFRQLQGLSLMQLSQQLAQLAQIDFQIKTGQVRPPIAIEQFILEA